MTAAALLFVLPMAAAFNLPGSRPSHGAADNSRLASPITSNTPGRRLEGLEMEPVAAPFGLSAKGNWFVCDTASDDPTMICFQAPEWMGLDPGAYVCSDALQSNYYKEKTSPEDSY